MPFDLVPPLDDVKSVAVRALLAASELSLASAPGAYATAWRRAAAEEAAGYGTDDMHADFEPGKRPYQVEPGQSLARGSVAEP